MSFVIFLFSKKTNLIEISFCGNSDFALESNLENNKDVALSNLRDEKS